MARVTGMVAGVVFTDPQRVIQSLTREYGYDPFEYWLGSQLVRLWRDRVITVTINMQDSQSSGINPVLGGSGKIESVTMAVAERINGEVPKIPRYPGEEVPDDEPIVKAYAPAVRWLGLNYTHTINGRGTNIWDDTDQGDLIAGTRFESADGSFYIELPSTARVEKVGDGATNNGDIDTWNGESNTFVANTGSKTTNIIAIPTEIAAVLPSSSVKILSTNYTMSGELDTNVAWTFTAACHLTV